ncbi:MGMT family protein [Candidatus Woesearchaeota archaeon]|nr:MAG: MGMT family protein [Candidatus Woesearchaeota archaeon]
MLQGVSVFSRKCYERLLQVPAGRVTTYSELARSLGSKGFRAVGRAMNKNPFAPHVPCHRVVASDGSVGGFARGVAKKVALLRREGVEVRQGKVVDFEKVFFRFERET